MNTGNSNRLFTEENINKLKRLNDKLKKEEQRIYKFSFQLEESVNRMKIEKKIDDYNIYQEFSLFSSNEDCNKKHKVVAGDPIWIDRTFNLFFYNKDDMFYSENWNELVPEHPLGGIEFCYTMHCICFHSCLTWQDLIDVDDIWIELKVNYQFGVKRI